MELTGAERLGERIKYTVIDLLDDEPRLLTEVVDEVAELLGCSNQEVLIALWSDVLEPDQGVAGVDLGTGIMSLKD